MHRKNSGVGNRTLVLHHTKENLALSYWRNNIETDSYLWLQTGLWGPHVRISDTLSGFVVWNLTQQRRKIRLWYDKH